MPTNYYHNRRGGHCPGHVRDTFLAALEAYRQWEGGEPEPLVEFEVKYEPRPIPISKACGLVWNCSDTLPGYACRTLEEIGLSEDVRSWTYGAAARAMHTTIMKIAQAA
jgi:hypothetical protein